MRRLAIRALFLPWYASLMLTLVETLASRVPDGPAVKDEIGLARWGEVERGSHAVAAKLLGARKTLGGARVALLASPGRFFVEALLGVFRAGGTLLVLSPLHPNQESQYFLADSGAGVLIASDDLAARAADLAGGRTLLVARDALAGQTQVPRARASLADAAIMLYTSGTTGKPKGALLSHGNLATQAELVGQAWGFSERDVLLHALPLHHMHGLCIAMLTALASGACVHMLPAFDAARVWAEMHDATVFMGVPTMYAKLFATFDTEDETTRATWAEHAKSLRLATSGSAALPVSLAERWRAVTGAIPLERFGMTEIGVGLTNPLEPAAREPGHVGFPLPTVEARIVGERGEDAESGELWIRGPSVFLGYHAREQATKDAFAGGGWFRTGDTVTRGASGSYRILGRTSVDILKSGGYKLSALEIEEALREHAAVGEVAVVGVPDEVWGERVVACVVAKGALSPEDLRAFAKQRLAAYKCPREVVLLAELPKNAMGKVQKPALTAMLGSRPK